jgi:Type IV secretion system pilin
MKFSKKIFFIFAMSIVFFWNAAPAMAGAVALEVEFNPLCWEKKECQDTRALYVGEGNAKSNEGWIENVSPCNKKDWGMCLPVNATKASISFGGSDTFSDAGVYIKTVYNYSLIIIGILAVVMIIIAGAQWITSAGNSEAIGSAKKRITGAIIGLFIAYMSYNILMSINPATINLRLPQIYMIRPQVLASKWCKDLAENKTEQMFAWGTDATKQSDKIVATNDMSYGMNYATSPANAFWCGQRFFIYGADAESYCWGDRCGKGTMCTDADPIDENNPYMCRAAALTGEVKMGGAELGFIDTWEFPWVNQGELVIICNDGSDDAVGDDILITDIEANETQSFLAPATPEEIDGAVADCEDNGGTKGFVLEFDFNANGFFADDKHRIGKGNRDIGLVYTHVLGGDDYLQDLSNLLPESLFSTSQIKSGALNVKIEANSTLDCFDFGTIVDECEQKYLKYYKPKP